MQDKVWDFSTKTQKKRCLLQSINAFCSNYQKKFTSQKNVLQNLFTHHLKYYSTLSTYMSL